MPVTPAASTLPRRSLPVAVSPAVLYRCTSFFDIAGTEHEQVFGWGILMGTPDAYEQMRRGAFGATRTLSPRAAKVLRSWLDDPASLPVLERTLRNGGVYELELLGAGSRIVLSLRPVLLLPLAHRGPEVCPALMLGGRSPRSQEIPQHARPSAPSETKGQAAR